MVEEAQFVLSQTQKLSNSDNLIGKRGYKKYGFYAGLIGTIGKNDFVTPYKIVFSNGSSVAAWGKDIEIVE